MPDLGKLYIVATPIGNLEDVSARMLVVLKEADCILCEDSRVTKKLLNKFYVNTQTLSYHQHSTIQKVEQIKEMLCQGKNLALVTDAGTPGISDPGNYLISILLIDFPNLQVISIPGPCAVIAGLSVSGFPTDKFVFFGFPPHKKNRKKFFQDIADSKHTSVFYESPHRIKKCFNELAEVLGDSRKVCVCRELTKKFETVYRGTIKEITEMNIPDKGEFVVIVN